MTRLSTSFNLPLDADPDLRRALQSVLTDIVKQVNLGTVIDTATLTGDDVLGSVVNLVDATAATRVCTLVPALDWRDKVLYTRARGGMALLVPQSGETIDGTATVQVVASGSRAIISDGANWHTVGEHRPGNQGLERNYGFSLTNGTDADHDIDVGAGGCWDSTRAEYISYNAATIVLDANWGSGGNLDTGSLPSDDIIFLYVTHDATQANSIVIGSTSATWAGVTKQSGFTKGRRIGAIATDSTSPGNIIAFHEHEGSIAFDAAQRAVNAVVLTNNSMTSQTITCMPPNSLGYGSALLSTSGPQTALGISVGPHAAASAAAAAYRLSYITNANASTCAGGWNQLVDASQRLCLGKESATGTHTASLWVSGYQLMDRFSE